AGRAALPEPLIETAMVAAGSLEGVVTAGVGTTYVAHADVADVILLEHAGELHAVPREAARIEPRDSVDTARPLFAVFWEPSASTRVKLDAGGAYLRGAL